MKLLHCKGLVDRTPAFLAGRIHAQVWVNMAIIGVESFIQHPSPLSFMKQSVETADVWSCGYAIAVLNNLALSA